MKIHFEYILLCFLVLGAISCKTEQKAQVSQGYLRMIGDILPDTSLDDPEFLTCNGDDRVIQYFNTLEGFRYTGEKSSFVAEIKKFYKPIENAEGQSGYLRIRFIVNCKGETGRFRVLSSDLNYQEKEFDSAIVNQLLEVVKSLNGWQPLSHEGKPLDYYQYVIFKIEKGNISEILP
ncbi:energy transducer TonB [Flagellimonas meridianipacifica]|uniref:TonB-like protein n=1 Tax=Flagellimonas meridianipacifica TaxID=1080225 RepID=A0A2T0MCX9_9FLAO|nr:hypothetical protein [Allomuricauda pacifica]PRX55350.1 hypothetical protein CLV81_3759 [Allomuricauda pacifica]